MTQAPADSAATRPPPARRPAASVVRRRHVGRAPAGAPRRRRSWWPLGLAALLAVSAGSNVGLMWIAGSDPSFAVEPNYYEKAVSWDRAMAQEAENAALGWSLTVDTRPAGRGHITVLAQIADRDGHPLGDARVVLEAFHGARASRVLSAALRPVAGGGYAATLPMDRAGLWELRLRVERGEQVFTKTLAQDLPGAR